MSDFSSSGPRMLLTEGKNDCHVICSLCVKYNIEENFQIYDCQSDERALKKLSALISSSIAPEVLGIVIDADNPSLRGKWDNLNARLVKEGYTLPAIPSEGGTILELVGKPKIGIWLMPNNKIDGMLEDFCAELASPDAIAFARKCTMEAKDNGFSTFIDNHLSKATVHAFLSWQDTPGMPLGQAITANALNGEHDSAVKFVEFLNLLFSAPNNA